MSDASSVEMLERVAEALGALKDEVVFVGGTTVALYLQGTVVEAPRATDDVDCVIEAVSLPEYHAFEGRLRSLGFEHCKDEGAPIFRWWVAGLKVDFMPQEPQSLGFEQDWYRLGYKNSVWIKLPSGRAIRVFGLPYYLAAKMDAHNSRGGKDPRLSQDLEDVVTILGSRRDLDALKASLPVDVAAALSAHFERLQKDPGFEEALSAALENRGPQRARVEKVRAFIASFSS